QGYAWDLVLVSASSRFKGTSTPGSASLSLHDALPICRTESVLTNRTFWPTLTLISEGVNLKSLRLTSTTPELDELEPEPELELVLELELPPPPPHAATSSARIKRPAANRALRPKRRDIVRDTSKSARRPFPSIMRDQ